MIEAERTGTGPIIHQGQCPSLGDNINGPCLVRRPTWVPGPGQYLLYFAHHTGRHIRLAFADRLLGPWTIHSPGVLPLETTPLAKSRPDVPQSVEAAALGQDWLVPHLASPDVWIDTGAQCFRMLFHGLADDGTQVSYRAVSGDGLAWEVEGLAIPQTYLRRFVHGGAEYAIGLQGQIVRLAPGGDHLGNFPIPGHVRHVGVLKAGNRLHVVFTRIGDAPERILHTCLDLSGPWTTWKAGAETEVLRPETAWEGAGLPLAASKPGACGFSNALRDPFLFEDDGTVWMIYAGGGEAALSLARIDGVLASC